MEMVDLITEYRAALHSALHLLGNGRRHESLISQQASPPAPNAGSRLLATPEMDSLRFLSQLASNFRKGHLRDLRAYGNFHHYSHVVTSDEVRGLCVVQIRKHIPFVSAGRAGEGNRRRSVVLIPSPADASSPRHLAALGAGEGNRTPDLLITSYSGESAVHSCVFAGRTWTKSA
jgi:hypothetical protein